MQNLSRFEKFQWIALLALCVGCSSGDMGTVTGTVKMDGKPLPNALLTFYPKPEGRASSGMTDENGAYELVFSRDKNGAVVGEHQVRITTAVEGGDYGDKMAKETVPAKYNISSELVGQVKPGSNVLDFDLESGGKIIQSGY